MPRAETVLQVFVASPSDVAAERSILAEVISELNTLWSSKFGVRLETVRWETHAFPAFGTDAQDVINRELPSDCDIFVGIMWTRFGTPTARAESGTLEEFERALARHKASPTAVQLMIYFKDAPVSPFEIDAAQLAAVRAFRERVGVEGGLHWRFSSPEDFRTQVRVHLSRVVQQFSATPQSTSSQAVSVAPSVTATVASADGEDNEPGFFDILERAQDTLSAVTDLMQRLSSYTEDLNSSITARTHEVNAISAAADKHNAAQQFKRSVNRLADDMNTFVRRTRSELGEFEDRLDDVFTATSTVASLLLDFGKNEDSESALSVLASQVESFGETCSGNALSVAQLRTLVLATPRFTSEFNRAKRATGETLADLSRIFGEAGRTSQRVAEGIRALGLTTDGDSPEAS